MELARSDTDAARAADAAKPSPASWPGPELEPGRQPPPLPGPELELGRQPPPLPGPKLELGRQPPPLPTPTSQPQAAAPKPPTDATHASTLARSRWATAGSSIPVVEANATAKSAAGSPAETTPLVLEGDVAGTPQPRASTATDKSRTCAESKFWDGVLWHNLSTLIPALLGLAPFMWPMEGEAQQCFIPSDDGDALNVTCAAVSKPVLVWYTFPVWLVLCACMLLEFFWFQLSALASGVRLYVSICIVAMVLLTYVLLELLGTDEILDTGYTAYGWQAFRVLSTAVCAWPFLAVGICLLWRHSYVVNRHPRHETKQDFGDVVSLARAAAVSRPRARGEAGAGAKAEVRAPAYLCVLVRAEASCCGLNCYHRDLSQYEKSVVYRSGIWSEPRQDLPVTLLTTSSDFEHDNRTQESEPTNTESAEEGHRVRLEKLQKKWLPRTKGWRQRAHMSPTTLASYRRSFTWMTIVFAGLIMNWVWLQLFVLLYMEHATTPTRIAIGGFVFNGSQAIFGGFVKTFANRADTERLFFSKKAARTEDVETKHEKKKSKISEASFHRKRMTILAEFAFLCYTGIFRQSLLVNITDWESFLSFYITNVVSIFGPFLLLITDRCHKASTSLISDPAYRRCPALCGVLGRIVHPDLLHHRGQLCCKAFLKNRANSIASMQYIIFILILNYTELNVRVFPNFSKEADFNLHQQLWFVAIAWSVDQIVFEAMNCMCWSMYRLTPIFVGHALRKEYPRLRHALVFVSAHIISDVYLSMLLALEGGFFFEDHTVAAV